MIYEQTKEIRKLFGENPDYVKLLSEPAIPFEERKGLIETAFGTQAERYLVNFIKLLCERNILHEFAGCCEEFTRCYHAEHGIAEAIVTSAAALKEDQISALKTKLEKISGKKVELKLVVDPTVLAGIRVEIEGRQLDGTVQSRLSGISRRLNDIIV